MYTYYSNGFSIQPIMPIQASVQIAREKAKSLYLNNKHSHHDSPKEKSFEAVLQEVLKSQGGIKR